MEKTSIIKNRTTKAKQQQTKQTMRIQQNVTPQIKTGVSGLLHDCYYSPTAGRATSRLCVNLLKIASAISSWLFLSPSGSTSAIN